MSDTHLLALGRAVLETEADAVSALVARLDDAFVRANLERWLA